MCGGPEHFRPAVARNSGSVAVVEKDPNNLTLDHLHLQDHSPHISLLELAADNDIQAFKKALEQGCSVEKMEGWYGRRIGSNQMSVEERTPLMVACSYGSLEIVTYVLSLPNFKGLVNQASKSDHVTALHCAAAGGAPAALEIIKLLLENGADPNVQDSDGQKPITVIHFSPLLPQMKNTLRDLLNDFDHGCPIFLDQTSEQEHLKGEENPYEEFVSGYNMMPVLSSTTSPLSTSPDSCAWSSPLFSPSSPKEELLVQKFQTQEVAPEILSVPDIKNTIYSTDEFRMFSFKIRPCSRAYSHDWTECPFVHPGENARRRDPRRYHYSCVPCPDFRKGACRRGDACEYAHGVFECWLHPAQYRTRLCKDGTGCGRRVCFFAHTAEELRPLYVSVSSAMSSPRLASSAVDSRPGSPPLQSTFMGSAFPSSSATTPPLSPSACMAGSWSQPSVPTLHLSNTSRLKAALSARDIADEQQEYDGYLVEDFSPIPSHGRSAVMGSAVMGSSAARIAKYGNLGLCIPPTNLQDLFASEVMSPMHLSPQEHSQITSQLQHCQFQSQLQQQRSSIHSPLQNSSQSAIQTQSALFHNISSPRPSSNRLSEMERQRPPNISTDIGLDNVRKAALMQRERGTWSPRDFNFPLSPTWSDWGSPSGKPDWGVQGTDLNKFRKSASFAHGGMEPDLSWVQKLVKEVPSDANSSLTHSMASDESNETVNRFLMV